MNDKVSRIQIGMFLSLICCSLFLGISDIIILRKSGNEVLVSMLLGVVLGLIPVLMYLKVNSSLPKLNIYEKNVKLFGKVFGNILNVLIILIYMVMLTMAIRAIVIFVTSKYLQDTPFCLVGLLVITTCLIICFKGLETLARTAQIAFFSSIVFMVVIEAFLAKYIEVGNILPIVINNNVLSILDGAIYFAASCSLLTMLLLTISKSKIKKPEKYNKTIILFYLYTSLSLTFVMFFIVSCLGYEMASLFRYPEYILLKKIGISSSELHLENLLAFRWVFYMIALANISTFGIIYGVKNFSKNVKINKVLVVIISVVCIFAGKFLFGNIPHSIITVKKFFIPFIALPMFIILLILFIRCLFLKKESVKWFLFLLIFFYLTTTYFSVITFYNN